VTISPETIMQARLSHYGNQRTK